MNRDPWSGLLYMACGALAVVLIILAAATADRTCTAGDATCEVR